MPCFTQFIRLFISVSLFTVLLPYTPSSIAEEDAKTQQNPRALLTLYNWSEYFDKNLIKVFEQQYNVNVNQVFYETDELKDEYLLTTNGGEGLDLIIGSETSFKSYAKQAWLAKLDKSLIPNIKHTDSRWTVASQALAPYTVPYLWGTIGITYRSDKISKKITSWLDLYQPSVELKGKIMMIDDSRDTLGLALKSLGYSLNSMKANELAAAEKLLRQQRPFVSKYGYISLAENSSIISGDTWMTMTYNGDGLTLQEMHPAISFVVPQEGTNLWADHIAILEKSKNKRLAHAFIDFINIPRNAAALAKTLNFATPNTSAKNHLDKEFLSNPSIYPDQIILNNSESFATYSPREQKKRNEIYMRIIE